MGNKLDLEMKRDVSKEQIENFKLNNEISESMEISLETRENVEKMFLRLTEMLLKLLMVPNVVTTSARDSILQNGKINIYSTS